MTQMIVPEIPEKARIMRNFYSVVAVYGAIWIIYHLSIVFFFGFVVGSPLLVGIFLGLGNLWSMCIDVPLGTIQRHVSSKTMFGVANLLMIICAIIFLFLVRTSEGFGFNLSGSMIDITTKFLTNGFNFILLLLVGLLYGTIKEIYDVTILAYLLNHNDPSEYDKALSKSNIYAGIGVIIGIILSIGILSLKSNSVEIILFVLIFLVICMWVFVSNYFDNSHEVFSLSTVENLHILDKVKNVEKSTEGYLKNTISTADFEQLRGTMDYIVMKPKAITTTIDWGDIYHKTLYEFQMIFRLIFERSTLVPILLWTTSCIFLFGTWDTIVTTFFIGFLDLALKSSGIQNIIQSGFVLIGILSLPAYTTQMLWINMASKYTKFVIITMGVFLSAIALFGLGLSAGIESLFGLGLVMVFGLLNSTGYAAGYPMSQSIFADEYNKAFAKASQSNIIDADASAAPLKILNNLANAVGLIFGGALISFVGFGGMFIVYGLVALGIGAMSVMKKTLWKLDTVG